MTTKKKNTGKVIKSKETIEAEDLYKGLLSPDSEELLADCVDKAIVADGLVELLDRPVALMAIRTLDNRLGDKLDQGLEADANILAEKFHDAYVNGNKASYQEAINAMVRILKDVLPLEKVITQAGEDAVMEVLRLVAAFYLTSQLDKGGQKKNTKK